MKTQRRSGNVLIATLLFGFAAGFTGPAAAVDDFYRNLLERGARDLAADRPAEAEAVLRIACFGLLDEPTLLAEGLVQLGRAQARLGSHSELEATLDRLIDLEDRFGAYTALARSDLKSTFEQTVRARLPAEVLARLSMFAPPAPSAPAAIVSRSAKQQRRDLEARLREAPEDPQLLFELAQLERTNRKLRRAATFLDRLLAVSPDHGAGRCLRAEIGVARKECAPALPGLRCPDLVKGEGDAAFLMRCLVAEERWPEARKLLAGFPDQMRNARGVARWAARIPEAAAADGPGAEPRTGDDTALSAASAQPPDPSVASAEPAIALGVSLEERLRRLRAEFDGVSDLAELEATAQKAAALADKFPDSTAAQHLAAEVAYRGSDWERAAYYFGRGGPPRPDQPTLLFYMAVASFEMGDTQRAADLLTAALPKLRRTPFVNRYRARILGQDSP